LPGHFRDSDVLPHKSKIECTPVHCKFFELQSDSDVIELRIEGKLSSVTTEADWATWQNEDIKIYIDLS